MIECYWNLKSNKWEDVESFECNTLASQFMYRSSPKGNSIGFHCQEHELVKYCEELKRREIKERENTIKKLQKEIDGLKSITIPTVM